VNENFEEKLKQSKVILEKLMDPEITLEESVQLYEDGLKNIKNAQDMLEHAKSKIETINRDSQIIGDND